MKNAGANAFIATMGAAAAGLLIWYTPRMQWSDWQWIAGLSLLTAMLNMMTFRTEAGLLSFGATVKMLAIFWIGLPVALWVALLAIIGEGLMRGWQFRRTLFSASQLAVSTYLATETFLALGGHIGKDFNEPGYALVAAGVYLLSTFVLTGAFVTLTQYQPQVNLGRTMVRMLQGNTVMTFLVGELLGITATFLLTHGGWFWVVILVALIVFLQFSFQRYFLILEDATAHQQELEAVLDASNSAILMVDKEGIVRVANPKYGEMFGVGVASIRGMHISDVTATPVLGELNHTKAELERRGMGPSGTGSAIIAMEQGPARYLDWYRAPVKSKDGTEEGIIEVFTDVSPVKQAEENLREMHRSMMKALTAAIDARDTYTHGHSARVSEFSIAIAQHIGLSDVDVERIGYSGLLHDIGKLGVDDRVLRKHGPLSPSERAIMMEHPVIGAEVLQKAGAFTELIPGVRWHHEWLNGGGYPDGLTGEQIPLDAKIIGVADAFDAMTSDRPYRRALTAPEAIARLNTGRGVQFDPTVVDGLIAAVTDGEVVVERPPMIEVKEYIPVENVAAASESGEPGTIRPVHGKELSILYQISKENYSRLNLSTMLRRFLEIFYDTLGHNVYMIFLLDEESGELVLHSSIGHAENLGSLKIKVGEGVIGRVAELGKPRVVPDVEQEENYIPAVSSTRSETAVPLKFNNELVGVLNVESSMPGAFGRDDIYLYEALAQQLSAAIELARYHERVAFAATHDGLTGVNNHSYFYERLTEEVTRAKRYGHYLSVVIMDLNGLKAINDTYGHMAGDRALKEYAELLKVGVRETDIVARYGGDEFAIIMPETPKSQAQQVVERLARSSQRTVHVDGRPFALPNAAYGIASFPDDAERATELVAIADRTMYQQKNTSRLARAAGLGGAPGSVSAD